MSVLWKMRNDGIKQRSYTAPSRKDIIRLYKTGLSSRDVGKKLNMSHTWVLKILKLGNIDRRSVTKPIQNPNYKKLTKSRAYILGVMCGDGCIFSGVEHKKQWSFKSYTVHLSVKDKDFVDVFIKHAKNVYGIEPRLYYRIRKKRKWSNIWVARLKRKLIYEDLLCYKFGHRTWDVPQKILNCKNKTIIGSFLRGFYDSEGSVCIGKRGASIMLSSTNFKGLQQIKALTEKLGIEASKINMEKRKRRNRSKVFYFSITHRDNYRKFLNLIGFSIKRKENKIKEYLKGLKNEN